MELVLPLHANHRSRLYLLLKKGDFPVFDEIYLFYSIKQEITINIWYTFDIKKNEAIANTESRNSQCLNTKYVKGFSNELFKVNRLFVWGHSDYYH